MSKPDKDNIKKETTDQYIPWPDIKNPQQNSIKSIPTTYKNDNVSRSNGVYPRNANLFIIQKKKIKQWISP